MVARPFLFPHLLIEGDDLATVLTAAGLPPAVPGEVIYRKMDDGSFRIEVVPTTGEPATVLGLSRRDLDVIFGLTEIDGELAYNGARIAGLTPEQETNLQTLNDTLATYEDRIAALENLAPPETVVITPLPIPPLTDFGPIMSGETFADILTRIPQFPATLTDGSTINASRTIDSTGASPTVAGDVIRAVRPIWTHPNAQTVIGEPVPIGVTVEQAPINTFITPGEAPNFALVGTIYAGDAVAEVIARMPDFPATAEDGTLLSATYEVDFDGGDPVAAGDQLVSVTPTWTTAEGFTFTGDPIPLGYTVAVVPAIILLSDATADGLSGLTTATTGQGAFDAWIGRPVAKMSDDSELTTLYEMRVGAKIITDLATLLPAGDLVITTTFSGFGRVEPISEVVSTPAVTVTVAAGQGDITGTPPDLPDPVLAGTPYSTQLGRVVAGSYPAVNGNTVTISDLRLRSAGVRVPHENRFNLITIGEVLTPVETVSATGAQTIDVAGADRTAIAATITETAVPSYSALSVGMSEAAVKAAVNVGAANANNGRTVAGEAIVTRNGQPFNGASLAGGDTVQISVKRTATGATDVTIDLGTVTVADAQTGTNATSMSYDGATATFSKAAPTGTYADGSPWVSSGGTTLSIIGISPASTVTTRTLSDGTTTTGAINGTMVDPGKAASGATLAARQEVNEGELKGAFNNQQGYDAYVASANQAYNASANVDPDKTKVPLALVKGTIVKAISITSGGPKNGRPTVEKLVPMTVVESPPAVGAFRPGHSDPSKVSWLTTAAVDVSKLPNIAKGSLPIPEFAATLAAVKRFISWQHTYNVLARNISPRADGAPVYGGDNYIYTEAILALCYDGWTLAQKTQIATAFVQMAIDITARAEQGAVWQDNGGHCAGQKTVVALAAHLTGHQRFKDVLGYTTTVYVWNGGISSIWGEDRQLFRITQADVNRAKPYKFTASQIGLAEWSSDATRKDPADRENYLNSLTLDIPGDDQSAVESFKPHYRHIVARVNVPGALALRLMGAAGFMQDTFLDYQDRHMAAHFEAPAGYLPDAVNNKLRPFTIAAWQRDRTTASAGGGTGGTGGTGGETGGNTPPPAPVIDYTTPAVGLFLSQSIIDYLFINNTDKNKGDRPTLLADNLTVYYYDGSYSGIEPLRKVVLTRALLASYTSMTNQNNLSSPVSYTMIRLANALHRALPGKKFVIGDGTEAGSSQISLVSDRVGWPAADKDRLWEPTRKLVEELYKDFGKIDRVGHHWYAADHKYMANWKEVMFPVWFGIYENGTIFPMGGTIPRAGTTGDHCIYDFKSSSPSDKGRGLLPRTVAMDMFKKGIWTKDTSINIWNGVQEFVDSAQFKSLGNGDSTYGHPLTGTIGGHPEPNLPHGPAYGQAEAMFETVFILLLRCAGLKIIPPRFVSAYTSSDGMRTVVKYYAPNGGNGLSTFQKVRGGAQNKTAAIFQDVWGFEISRASGGGTYWICRPGAPGIDPKYQATVTRLGPDEVLIEWVVPVSATGGDELSHLRGHGLHRSDYERKAPASDSAYLNLAIEDMPNLRGTGADFPFAGFMADSISPLWSLERGKTVGEGLPAGAVGGGAAPTPTPEPDPTPEPEPTTGGFGTQVQTAVSNKVSTGRFHSVSLPAAPTAGNLLLVELAVDKSSDGTSAPTGFQRLTSDVITPSVSGCVFWRTSDGTEVNFNASTTTAQLSTIRVTEIKGPFNGFGLIGELTAGAEATSVALSTGNASQDDLYAHAIYMNDSRSNITEPVAATNGFTAQVNHQTTVGAHPGLITARKVVTAAHNPRTTGVSTILSHAGTIDQSIGFLITVRKG